jgi:type III secretion protein D
MHFELRILNGLHRGAALPLDGTALDIGAGEQAGVVLADPGVAAHHATLAPTDTGWLLEARDGAVVGVDDPRPQSVLELGPGGYARLGAVWLCISAVDAAWQAPPEPTGLAEPAPVPPAAPVPAVRRRALRRVLLPIGALVVLSGATACAIAVRAPAASTVVAPAPARPVAAATPVTPTLTPAQLQAAFRRELGNAQLLERFELALGTQAWTMRADLDPEEKAHFERLLKKFMAQHRLTIPVDAKIVGAAAMLPFDIAQVVSGSHAGIVTADGARLYVGDDYRGVRLVSVRERHLVFAGKRKIEVNW